MCRGEECEGRIGRGMGEEMWGGKKVRTPQQAECAGCQRAQGVPTAQDKPGTAPQLSGERAPAWGQWRPQVLSHRARLRGGWKQNGLKAELLVAVR